VLHNDFIAAGRRWAARGPALLGAAALGLAALVTGLPSGASASAEQAAAPGTRAATAAWGRGPAGPGRGPAGPAERGKIVGWHSPPALVNQSLAITERRISGSRCFSSIIPPHRAL